mgnify:CR=1 FL=1
MLLHYHGYDLNTKVRGVAKMKHVIQTLLRNDAEKRLPVLKMEINYELAMLHEAIESDHTEQIESSKQKLEELRQEWIRLEA